MTHDLRRPGVHHLSAGEFQAATRVPVDRNAVPSPDALLEAVRRLRADDVSNRLTDPDAVIECYWNPWTEPAPSRNEPLDGFETGNSLEDLPQDSSIH